MSRLTLSVVLVAAFAFPLLAEEKPSPKPPLDIPAKALVMVVMDPLALPLSCPCVEGYAQRNYDKLAEFLTAELGRPVVTTYNQSLRAALKMDTGGRADIVIGKHSVVLWDAKQVGKQFRPVLSLSGKDGQTDMTGMFLVAAADPAKTVADLKDYRIFFGTEDSDEKFAAAFSLLKKHGIDPPNKPETCAACSDGAVKLLELGPSVRSATVISSYAAPLLEGCGTVKKGDLRIIGTTASVPFVEAFVSPDLPSADQAKIEAALLKVGTEVELLQALETLLGFVPIEVQKKKLSPSESDWPGWRGANRDAVVAWLPDRLSDKPAIRWRTPLSATGIGGVAATQQYVLVSDRELDDTTDCFRCLAADTGKELWAHRYPAPGLLDYGNSPRATPLIAGERCWLLGAHGELSCLELATGRLVWQLDVKSEFGLVEELKWGLCGSPLVVDGKLILYVGGPQAALVALDPATGKTIWKTPGNPPGYGSLAVGTLGGLRQIVGHDATTLGGWEIATGKRLWTLAPPIAGDFNVPTPIIHRGRLIVATENNGTRLFAFDQHGIILPKPVAVFADLNSDTHTPVVAGDRLIGVMQGMYCLDLADSLKLLWSGKDEAFFEHTSLIASGNRVLVSTSNGGLLLVDAAAERFRLLGRLQVFEGESGLLSHPALMGKRLYLRGSNEIVCVDLER